VIRLLGRARAADGRDPLSEHKYLDFAAGGSGLGWWEGERLVGYVHAVSAGAADVWEVETIVDPAARTRRAWHDLVEASLAALAPRRLHLWARDPDHIAVVQDFGWRIGRRLLQLRRPLPPQEEPQFPPDVEVGPFRPDTDEEPWLAAHRAAFASHPEIDLWTRDWLADRCALDWFDPDGFLLARAGNEVAAYCWTKVHDDGIGEIFSIGVHPAYQGLGLGRAMSLAGLWALYDRRGVTEVMLFTDGDNVAGLAMYRGLGFTLSREEVCFVVSEGS